MPNLSNPKLTEEQRLFIDELASLLTPWGLSVAAARLYGYLQICNEPASLDEIATELQMSKSSACSAAKLLESHDNAKKLGERGTKRVLYVAGADPGTPLSKQIDLLGRMSVLIAQRKDLVADGAANVRLAKLSNFHAELRQAIETVTTSSQAISRGQAQPRRAGRS